MADAFFVALRLPNHFRAIFAEGALNAAFIPAYARVRVASCSDAVRVFGDRIFTLLLASQIVLLGTALLFTPGVIDPLAPGFSKEPAKFARAIELTRITFPYLLLVSLVTLRHPQCARPFCRRGSTALGRCPISFVYVGVSVAQSPQPDLRGWDSTRHCRHRGALWAAHLQLFQSGSLAAWTGLGGGSEHRQLIVQLHLFDFTQGWAYVIGVGIAGGIVLKETRRVPKIDPSHIIRHSPNGTCGLCVTAGWRAGVTDWPWERYCEGIGDGEKVRGPTTAGRDNGAFWVYA